jgi:hypothetical protein
MAAKKTKPKPEPSVGKNGVPLSYVASIRDRLSSVDGIEAVYLWVEPHRAVQVVSVVEDHDSALYDFLIPQEELVEKQHPEVAFDFHVRARQKRTLESVIPSGTTLVFKK